MNRVARYDRALQRRTNRRGTVVPFLVATILVILLVAAWVIDRAWVSSVCGEIVSASESAAHAAARELLDDTRLLDVGEELRLRRARYAAERMGAANRVAGRPVQIDATSDVRFAKSLQGEWAEDVIDPRVVAVRCGLNEARGGRLGLLLSGIGGVNSTEISHLSRVQLENRLASLKADESRPLAMLPIGISMYGSETTLGWSEAIVEQQGDDYYSIDDETNSVAEVGDGIPEIRVTIDSTADANGAFVHSGGFSPESLMKVVHAGYTSGDIDLRSFASLLVSTTPENDVVTAFGGEDLLGRQRVMFLTDGDHVTGAVGGRVMAIEHDGLGRPVAVVQPTVIVLAQATIETQAVLPESNTNESNTEPNPYLFKLVTLR